MKNIQIRPYDPKNDSRAIHRLWREIGWLDDDKQLKTLDVFLSGGRTRVMDLNGEAECVAVAMPAQFQYLKKAFPLSVVAAVTTSLVARKQGLAKQATAQLVREEAEAGAPLSTLGIFEQGFYNQLGYGSGGYEHWISFDPADIKPDFEFRVPQRLDKSHYKEVSGSLRDRMKDHGSVTILSEDYIRGEMSWKDNYFGLGYSDGPGGELTHFFWGTSGTEENGPLKITALAYQNYDQFTELIGLLKSLGDQFRLVIMREPAGIQMQDLLHHPFRHFQSSERGKFESKVQAISYWQMRICDLDACLKKSRFENVTLRFNLKLRDPIDAVLLDQNRWHGIAGDYKISLGAESKAEPGLDSSLPTLTAGVGAFTRLWLGVLPASGLSVTDDLTGPQDLLTALDDQLRLPDPKPGWDY